MADKKDQKDQPAVTRIRAKDTVEPAKKRTTTGTDAPSKLKGTPRRPLRLVGAGAGGVGGYFKGAWFELRQVRWPNRRATWGLTGALLAFTAFFVIFILLIDSLFEYLFKLMLG